MYQRELQHPKPSPVEHGIPLQGTWDQAFDDVDLLSVHHPYAWPIPKWMKDLRIKEWQSFIIQDEDFYLEAILSNIKYYRLAQVFLYDKLTREHLRFRKIIPFGGWRLPRELSNSSISSKSYGFFFRIHDWLDADMVKVDLDIESTRKRPSFTAHLEFDLAREKTTPLVASLLFADRRPMYVYKGFGAVRGDMVYGGRHISFNPDRTLGVFSDYKGYYPYRMQAKWCTAFGFDPENRRYGFSIAENQARETFQNNENALWLEEKLTPLPPVRITMPRGVDSDWVIQDVEGMVDLTFSPKEPMRTAFSSIVTRSEYHTPLGYYNGVLVNSDGKEIQVRNLWGLGEKLYLRV
ncbi:DUF2804 domain-containing protein [Breznakiella homolactica]|uniref:DUF2804 domain-containing protein n=1 Tax=Breznakiella homolactica TaxID=2798577 RepID=A0A7T7XPW4_9SPIR|nr:DUF2804 domain-containing protein [Breznakiella homolactica]QQO10284.1 DUF2804 domain-containing protein [Breznakiella homolactica]